MSQLFNFHSKVMEGGKCWKLFREKSEINWENKKVSPDIIQLFPGPNWLAAFVLKF